MGCANGGLTGYDPPMQDNKYGGAIYSLPERDVHFVTMIRIEEIVAGTRYLPLLTRGAIICSLAICWRFPDVNSF